MSKLILLTFSCTPVSRKNMHSLAFSLCTSHGSGVFVYLEVDCNHISSCTAQTEPSLPHASCFQSSGDRRAQYAFKQALISVNNRLAKNAKQNFSPVSNLPSVVLAVIDKISVLFLFVKFPKRLFPPFEDRKSFCILAVKESCCRVKSAETRCNISVSKLSCPFSTQNHFRGKTENNRYSQKCLLKREAKVLLHL